MDIHEVVLPINHFRIKVKQILLHLYPTFSCRYPQLFCVHIIKTVGEKNCFSKYVNSKTFILFPIINLHAIEEQIRPVKVNQPHHCIDLPSNVKIRPLKILAKGSIG